MDYDILEGYMRIKMNAAKSVREFPAIIYSKKWSVNHMLADDPRPKKKRRLDEFDDTDPQENLVLLRGRRLLF